MTDHEAEEYERTTAGEWNDDKASLSWPVIAVIGLILAGGFVFLRIKGVM
jgi:hypothetical protein